MGDSDSLVVYCVVSEKGECGPWRVEQVIEDELWQSTVGKGLSLIAVYSTRGSAEQHATLSNQAGKWRKERPSALEYKKSILRYVKNFGHPS